MRSLILIPAVAMALAAIAYAPPAEAKACKVNAASAAAGKRVYLRCQACHGLDSGPSRAVGPNLGGMFSGKPLSAAGYNYSPAFKKAKPDWTDNELLDRFLENPKAAIPGNKMIFPGLRKALDRANLIAYLKSETSC